MKLLICLVLFIFSISPTNALIINEIMYNPSGSDSGHEWIEVYNDRDTSINLEGWKLFEDDVNHALISISGNYALNAGEYAVVADEYKTFLLDYPDFYGTLLDSAWSSLSNSGEYIAIKNSSLDIVDEIVYPTELANGNGKSLERFDSGWNQSSFVGGSPGKQNNATISEAKKGLKLTVNLDEAYVGATYTSLFRIENLDHISGITDNINLTIYYNVSHKDRLLFNDTISIEGLNSFKTADTGLFSPSKEGIYTITGKILNSSVVDHNQDDDIDSKEISIINTMTIPCNIALNITKEKVIYNESESVKFYNNLNNESLPFTIRYWIEDFFEKTYKNPINTSNTNQKSWKTNIDEEDRVLFIKSEVYPLCNDTNITDNFAESMLIVRSRLSDLDSIEDSRLEITEIDKDAKFGEIIDVKVTIYKGNTNKYSVSLWAEDNGDKISETTKIHLYDKYSSYTGQIPLKIDANCNGKLDDGRYRVILGGLDNQYTKRIEIGGIKSGICPGSTSGSTTTTSSVNSRPKGFEYDLMDFNEIVDPGKKFSTKVKLDNNDDKDISIKVWSYVYRGPNSYSGPREENMKTFTLKANSLEIIELSNVVAATEPGEYKLKVMVNKDNQKTNDEITKDITISSNQNSVGKSENNETTKIQTNSKITNNILSEKIYKSSNEKTKHLVPIFIIILSIMLNIVLIWRR
jgi:hypothetical protein